MEFVTPPSPRSLSADSNRPRQKRKGRSTSRGGGEEVEPIDRGSESKSSTTSTQPSLGRRPYSSSLSDDSSDPDVDLDPLRKDSISVLFKCQWLMSYFHAGALGWRWTSLAALEHMISLSEAKPSIAFIVRRGV